MIEDWPPEGYSHPTEYNRNKWIVLSIGLLVSLPLAVSCLPLIKDGAFAIFRVWRRFLVSIPALAERPIVFFILLFVVGVLIFLLWILSLSRLMVVVHERLHYEVGRQFDLNPEYRHDYFLWFENPGVIALSTGIPRNQNILMLVAPFIIIGLVSLLVMEVSSGIIAASAAFVLLINSAGSALDLYHVIRLLSMPQRTLFANFEEGSEIRTEYAFPK